VRAVENCAADSSGADPHDRDVLFEDARIHCLAADIHVWLDKMEKPVNFDYVRFTSDGRAYFQDPDCPGWIQVVENHVWTSKSVSLAKMYFLDHTAHVAEFGLTLDRGILGEEMKRIVEEAEILLSSNQSGTATPAPSQNPTLPSLPSHHAKISSRPPSHESVGKRKAPQRRLLPSSHSSSSISTRKRPLFQAPNEQTQALQSTSSCWYLNDDFYSVRLNNF
jgi:hypothetical protein